jgi:hypothetical protein
MFNPTRPAVSISSVSLEGQMPLGQVDIDTVAAEPLLPLDRETGGLKKADQRLLKSSVLPDWAGRTKTLTALLLGLADMGPMLRRKGLPEKAGISPVPFTGCPLPLLGVLLP